MAYKRNFRSKTQWIGQPRDSNGRWKSIGGAVRRAGSATARVGSALARASGVELGYSINPWKTSAGANATYTKRLPGGFSSTTEVVTRIHRTDNKSIFGTAANKAADAGLSRINNRTAQGIARAATGVYPSKVAPDLSSTIRVDRGGLIRSKTLKQRSSEQLRVQKKAQKKLRKRAAVVRARTAGSTGQPSTLTKGKPRPARRNAKKIGKGSGTSITGGKGAKMWGA